MCLVALLKLSSRFPFCSRRIKVLLPSLKEAFCLNCSRDPITEKHQNIRSALVERISVLDEATFNGRKAGSILSAAFSTSLISSNGIAPSASAPLVDLLDLGSDESTAPTSLVANFLQDLLDVGTPLSSQSGTTQAPKSGTDFLMDLLSIGSPAPQNSSSNLDTLSTTQDNKASVSPLDGLSLATMPSVQTSPSSMMVLLDGFGPTPPPPELWVNYRYEFNWDRGGYRAAVHYAPLENDGGRRWWRRRWRFGGSTWGESAIADNSQQTDTSTDIDTNAKNQGSATPLASDLAPKVKEALIDDHFELSVDFYSQAIIIDP